jgi:hypothetical protein
MTEKNSLIPNMYLTQYRLICRLNQIALHPSMEELDGAAVSTRRRAIAKVKQR